MKKFLSVLFILGFAGAALAGDGFTVKAGNETHDRNVDYVAVQAQESAIYKLNGLLKKYRNTKQEAILLARLAEAQQQRASILFRIVHATNHSKLQRLNLKPYHKAMQDSIKTLTKLIETYPKYEELSLSYFMRAKAYEEIGDKKKAIQDYLYLVKTYPECEQLASSYMALAEFSIEDNKHKEAIAYLEEVEKQTLSPHYPFALYKLAWSYYNLKDVPRALSYIERNIQYYSTLLGPSKTDVTSTDNALRDNSLLDSTLFYSEGYEQGLAKTSLSNALPYFKSLNPGPVLGRMLVKFGNLLRAHEHTSDLLTWKNLVLKEEFDRPETIDVVLTAYEDQLNKQKYPNLIEIAQNTSDLYKRNPKAEAFKKAHKLLLDTAENLQKILIKNKGVSGLSEYSEILAKIYDTFTKIVDEADPRIPKVHYNLAETLFEIKDFEKATTHYRWIVDHLRPENKKDTAQWVDASLKAIGSRYEVLGKKELIPKDLKPISLQKEDPSKIDPFLEEWVGWVDRHLTYSRLETDRFFFESNRAIYAQGQVHRALERLMKFVKEFSTSEVAIPSASLVLDTFIATSDWKRLQDLALEYIDVKAWKNSTFSNRLVQVASDAGFKLIEIEFDHQHYEQTLQSLEKFLKKGLQTQRLGDALFLGGRAALELNQKKRALGYFTRLVSEVRDSERVGAALMARISIVEDQYQFSSAVDDISAYLQLPEKQKNLGKKSSADFDNKLRKKALLYSWLAGDKKSLQQLLSSKVFCVEGLEVECDKYLALSQSSFNFELFWDKYSKGYSENKAIWGLALLENPKGLSHRDQLGLIKHVAGHWDDLDPLVQFSLLPSLTKNIPLTFKRIRGIMQDIAPLRAQEAYIRHRVDVIKENENAVAKAMKLPWLRLRALVLNEMAGFYLDFSQAIHDLPPPKNLSPADMDAYNQMISKIVLPFDEKGQDLRSKAFDIASKFAIEEDSYQEIAVPFARDNPSQYSKLVNKDSHPNVEKLDLSYMKKIDPDGGWRTLTVKDDDNSLRFKVLWISSLQSQTLQQTAFLMNEAKEKKWVKAEIFPLLKVLSLTAAGQRAEGLAELEDKVGNLPLPIQIYIKNTLKTYYLASLNNKKAAELEKEVASLEEQQKKTKKG